MDPDKSHQAISLVSIWSLVCMYSKAEVATLLISLCSLTLYGFLYKLAANLTRKKNGETQNGIKKQKPSFFKVIIPGFSTRQLRIPPPFLELIRKDLSDKATLNSNTCSDRSWNVGVIKTRGSVYFKDGWQEFLEDNSVEDGDFVVFEYEGRMHFSVQVYDNSCCERDSFLNTETHRNPPFFEWEIVDHIADKRLPGIPRKSHIGCSKFHCLLNSNKGNSESFKSNYPHVTKVIKKTYCVYAFPTSFYREHLSQGNYDVVFLKNAEGKNWYQVKLVRSIGTVFLSKGWSKFACSNHIKVGNVCVFEVVEENKMVVHVFQQ